MHDDDKRRSVLDLTEAGWAIHDVVAPMARARERAVLDKLERRRARLAGRASWTGCRPGTRNVGTAEQER